MYEVLAKGLGKNVEEAVVKCWYFTEGDRVSEGDDLVELAVGDSSVTIPVPAPGILAEVYFSAGEMVQRDELICVIDEKGEGLEVGEDANDEDNDEVPVDDGEDDDA